MFFSKKKRSFSTSLSTANRSLYAVLHVFDERTRADNTDIDSEKNKTIVSRHLIYLFLSFDVFIIPDKGAFVKPLFYFFTVLFQP